MLCEYMYIWDGHLSRISIAKHRIELLQPDIAPHLSALCRTGPKPWEFEKAEINKLHLKNIIKPAKAEWSALIVLVTKKDGTLQFCMDYRNLNFVTSLK